jgi:predicted dehydrogenase
MPQDVVYNSEYTRRLKTCFIGCGGHAIRNVYPTFQYAPVDLMAVCDLDPQRAAEAARIFGASRTYSDHHEMLAREKPEVVFIVTSYDENGLPLYPRLAIDCMKAGAHAWIEKPPASSRKEVEAMMEVSRETGKHVGVGFKKMFFPANVKAKEIISSPEFGKITSIVARYPQHFPSFQDRQNDNKMKWFLDHMVHPHSLLKLLAGDIDWIFVNPNEIEHSAMVSLKFKSGAIGNLHFAAGISGVSPFERTEIVGQGANVIVENNIRVIYYRKGTPPKYGRGDSWFGPNEEAPLVWEPEFSLGQLHNKGIFLLGYAPEVIDFTTRILDGKAPEKGSLEDALEIAAVYEAYRKPDLEMQRIVK